MKKLLLILSLLLVLTGCENEKTVTEEKITAEEEYADEWTVEMTVIDVTPTSLRVKLAHTGDVVDTIFGEEFFIETIVDGEWTQVPALCEPYWNLVAFHIPHNSSTEFEESFEFLYGTLPEGHYRIGKEVTVEGTKQGVYAPVKFTEDIVCYAEFDI